MPIPHPFLASCPLRRTAAVALAVVFAVALVLNATAAENGTEKRKFDVPPGSAERALKEFSAQSGLEVLFVTESVANIRTQAAQGMLTPREAIDRMLSGTKLVAVQDAQTGALRIRRDSDPNGQRAASAMGDRPTSPIAPAPFATPASSGATGTISGRIYKPGTGEYVRNAEIRIAGTDRVVESEAGGQFQIFNVPAGEATLTVTSLGSEPVSETIVVSPGQTAVRDFELRPSQQQAGRRAGAGEALRLDEFIVSAEREGHSKALQDQKRGMNISNVVGSEVFGNQADGNVGEFLKYVPGVELEYVNFEPRSARLRGMDPQYTSVTLDGIQLASADAFNLTFGTENNGNEASRAMGFESISLSSIDSIQVFKTLSADLDAGAPAGTINLRSKRAFDRKGRRISWQTNATASSEEFYLKATPGPNDSSNRKIRPGGILEYSDQFLNNRLGIVLNLTRSDTYNDILNYTYNTVSRTPTAGDPRPTVPTSLSFVDSPKLTQRTSATFTADFKASPKLNFGVTTTLGWYTATGDYRTSLFTLAANNTGANGRSTVLGAEPDLSFTTGANGDVRVGVGAATYWKTTNSVTITPRFEFKPTRQLSIVGRFGYSYANNDYESLARGTSREALVNDLGGIGSGLVFKGERPSRMSSQWKITQLAGPDWADLTNYSRPRVSDDARLDINEVMSGQLDTTYSPEWKWLSFVKFGIKSREEKRDFRDERNWARWEYIGPGGVTPSPTLGVAGTGGSFAGFPSPVPFDQGTMGTGFFSISGRPPLHVGKEALGRLFQERPDYFSQTAAQTPANYFSAFIGNPKNLTERVDAAYLMGSTRLGKLTVQAGLRFEETRDDSLTFDPRSRAEVLAAGYTVDGSGRANTIPGLQYQFETLPRVHVKGDYHHYFPSVGLRYPFGQNLIAQAGFNKAISRPPLLALTGPILINEQSQTISLPNAGLLPETSNNFSAKLAYYFEPAGTLSVGVFQNEIANIRETYVYEDPEDFARFGLDSGEYPGYRINSTINGSGQRRFRGVEFEYRQSLTFLPGALNGLNVFANYTRNYANVRRGGLSPHAVSAGTSYNYKWVDLSVRAVWTPDVPWTQNIRERFREERTLTDVGVSFRLRKNITLSVDARNVFNKPYRLVEDRPEGRILQVEEVYGALYTFSLRGYF